MPPESVNFSALPSKLVRICLIRPGSLRTVTAVLACRSKWNSSPLARARNEKADPTSFSTDIRSKGIDSTVILPASIFDKSRMSLMITSSPSADCLTSWAYSFCSTLS